MPGFAPPASASIASYDAMAARRLPVVTPTIPVTTPIKAWPAKPTGKPVAKRPVHHGNPPHHKAAGEEAPMVALLVI